MNEPIKAGDLAVVVSGMLGDKSPNIGMVVKVMYARGEHSQFGRIWACDAEYATRGQHGTDNLPGGTVDFAQSWLKKIPPPPMPGDSDVIINALDNTVVA